MAIALYRVRVFGMPLVTKSTMQFLFSFGVLIWAGFLLALKVVNSTEVMPVVPMVVGHFYGTQAQRSKWSEEKNDAKQ